MIFLLIVRVVSSAYLLIEPQFAGLSHVLDLLEETFTYLLHLRLLLLDKEKVTSSCDRTLDNSVTD
jgi:hypothetical protein